MPSTNHAAAHLQLLPQPRLAVGQALLRRRLATAAIDLSDGLSTDLAHLCHESGIGAEILAAALPIHPLAMHQPPARALDLALNGGEDYELLFAAPSATRMPRSLAGVPITRIGTITRETKISLLDTNGRSRPLPRGGWQHFAPRH
jgi:thiamine-monophosphate kinase